MSYVMSGNRPISQKTRDKARRRCGSSATCPTRTPGP
ncbi:hypothetical protein [Bifidobacterium bifidum]|nr:hypothetical protein [Bifidobacterium bifidum]